MRIFVRRRNGYGWIMMELSPLKKAAPQLLHGGAGSTNEYVGGPLASMNDI